MSDWLRNCLKVDLKLERYGRQGGARQSQSSRPPTSPKGGLARPQKLVDIIKGYLVNYCADAQPVFNLQIGSNLNLSCKMEITYQYTKKRSTCGRQPLFCEAGPDMCDSIATDPSEHKRYILRNPVHEAIQHGPIFSQCNINTIRAEYTQSGANHSEGGWAKDINILDIEATQRYRRKIEKEDNYIHCIMALTPGMEHYVYQNNAIDMYRAYYREMEEQPAVERTSVRTVNEYRDPSHRPISSICWQPEGGFKFAVTYVAFKDFFRNPRGPLEAFIWDVENANFPEQALLTPAPLIDLQFSPRDKELLGGGLATGQVAVWDRRVGPRPVSICPPHVAHRDMVRSVLFINSKSGQEFFSGGPDGACKWWDMRNMEEPTDTMIMDVVKASTDVQSMATANGICVLEYEPTIPTRFMVGTENGLVVSGNRKGKTPLEMLPAKYEAHTGPVVSLERNPGFLKNFLTIGDWRIRIWSEECRDSPVVWSAPMRQKVTSGAWSPVRLSLLCVTSTDGRMQLWDLLRRQHQPVLTQKLCGDPLLKQKFHEQGSLLGLGSERGTVYLVELSHQLAQTDKNDKSLMTAIFERETKRERILEARLREIKLKMRQAEEGEEVASLSEDPTVGDKDLAEATADYNAQVKKEMTLMY